MTEREVRKLLKHNAGQPICVAYNTRADGTLAMRSSALPIGIVALAGLVAGCAGHAEGYVTNYADDLPPAVEGCPVIPAIRSPESVVIDDPSPPKDSPPQKHVRVNFTIDPSAERRMVGIIVADYEPTYGSHHGHHEPLDFEPTAQLWANFIDRVRARREERKRVRAKLGKR